MYEVITVPVTMMLAKLASHTVIFNEKGVNITPGSTFGELTVYYMMHSKKMVTSTVAVNGTEDISRTIFQRNTLNGASYLESIELTFKSVVMVSFITDE